MKLVTYWENPPGQETPWLIEAFLDIMASKLGDRFLLLDPANLVAHIGDDHAGKHWSFRRRRNRPSELIVAKADYIRFAYVYRHGGFWLDADNLCVGDPNRILDLLLETDGILWGSEGYFGSRSPGNECFGRACKAMLEAEKQVWGNPGGINDYLPEATRPPDELFWPKPEFGYWWDKTDMLLRADIEPSEFLSEGQVALTTYHSCSDLAGAGPDSLLARLLRQSGGHLPAIGESRKSAREQDHGAPPRQFVRGSHGP